MQGAPANSPRFEIQQYLGRGGMGVVYKAFDRELGRVVALKTIAPGDGSPDAVYRFKREFRSLAELSHPNLIALYELVHQDGEWFFTMELLEGLNFLSWVTGADVKQEPTRALSSSGDAPPAPARATDEPAIDPQASTEEVTRRRATDELDEAFAERTRERPDADQVFSAHKLPRQFDPARLEAALRQLVRGVQALHDAGKQHRDLKPENVMVTKQGRVVLLDFGLALDTTGREFYQEASEIASLSGTPAYMAPERLLGRPATRASDWYAVGVMLYEALTSTRPHHTIRDVIEGPLPRPPHEMIDDVPEVWSTLAMDLLRRDGSTRPDGPEILRRLGEAAPGVIDPLPRSASDELVGRGHQLRALERAFAEVAAGGAVQVRVQGPSGYGKSALVNHFLADLIRGQRAIVLQGRCYERESVPYKVFDALVDSLSRYLNGLPPKDREGLLPEDAGLLARLFPSLLRVHGLGASPDAEALLDVQELSRRAARALKTLFGNLASRQPLVLFVDDLQWGDVDSARLLAELLVPPTVSGVMQLVSYRSEDLRENQVLKGLLSVSDAAADRIGVQLVEVGPLESDEAAALASRVLGDRAGLERVIAEAAGSPFFLQQLAQYVAASRVPLGAGALSLATVLEHRIAALPGHTRSLLEVVAIAGRPLRRDAAMHAAELDETGVDALNALRADHWVRVTGSKATDTIETYHDKIREVLTAGLPPERTRGVHRRIATWLEADGLADAEALTAHWLGAGEPTRALGHSLRAAAAATRLLAFDRAAELYRLALSLMSADSVDRRSATLGMAQALKNAGRGPEAARAFLEAAERSVDSLERLECERWAFEQFLISGYLDEGRAVARRVLTSVGLSMPDSRVGGIASLLYRRARVKLRGEGFVERQAEAVPRADLTRLDVCWSMAIGLSLIDTKLGSDFAARTLLYALDAGEPDRLARAMALEAAHQANIDKGRAQTLIERAALLAERCGVEHAIGFVEQNRGFVEYFHGRYGNALGCFDRAARRLRERCRGVSWELSTCHMMSNWSLVYLGEWSTLTERSGPLLAEARATGDLYRMDALSISQGVTTGLMRDDVEGTREEMRRAAERWTPPGFQVQHYFRLLMSTCVDLYAGEPERAWEALLREWPALQQSLLLTVEDVNFRMSFIRGFAALAMPDSSAMRAEAARAARVARKTPVLGATGVANVLSSALRLREGKPEEAARLLEEAALDFGRAGMALFQAAAKWRWAAVTDAPDEAASAEAEMRRRGLLRPEKLLRLYAPGFPA